MDGNRVRTRLLPVEPTVHIVEADHQLLKKGRMCISCGRLSNARSESRVRSSEAAGRRARLQHHVCQRTEVQLLR